MKKPESRAQARKPSKIRENPPNRRGVVKRFCLYPGDIEKLRAMCGGVDRQESLVVRYLIRKAPKKVPPMDLFQVKWEDGLLRSLNKGFGLDLVKLSPERE